MITHRLVVADAQTLFTEALAEAMRASGHEVLAACATRRELSAALRSTAVTACLSELRLADGDATEVLAHAAAANPACHLIVVTDDARPDVLRSVLEAGAAGYVQKSRGLQVLLDALERVSRGEIVVEASLLPASSARIGESVRARALREALTNRERQCLDLIVQGKDTSAMSRELHVSRTTVRSHVQALLTKLGVHSRLEAAALAARLGLLSGGPAAAHGTPSSMPLPAERHRPRGVRRPLNG